MTAYIEFVATRPDHQGNGYATRVMECLMNAIPHDYELSALSPAETGLYERLGWRFWRGPLYIRMPGGELTPTPEERVMILELPGRPQLQLDAALSAEWRAGEVW
jgi:aminoglycoside 2'-N-acetyltransferase I